jgi:TnpA family transposase
MLEFVAQQISVPPAAFADYAQRDTTRREHQVEAYKALGLRPFTRADVRSILGIAIGIALQNDNGLTIVAGKARNFLARAVFFNRLGELRDRTYENQRHKASGLNLVIAAIILWNTVYLERATTALRAAGHELPDDKLIHVAPLSWEHINLTGDYAWREAEIAQAGQRPLGPIPSSITAKAA